jgi:hypothetical protein
MRNIEVATRDEVYLHIQSPMSKHILVKICTVNISDLYKNGLETNEDFLASRQVAIFM